MDDDLFSRVSEREDEVRRRLEAGEISDDEAAGLRDLMNTGPEDIRLSVDQLRRLVDEGIEADQLRAALDLLGTRNLDEVIDLIADYAPEESYLRAVARIGGRDMSVDQVRTLLDNDLDPDALAAMLTAAPDIDFETAVALCIEEVDPQTIARLREEGIDVDFDRLISPSIVAGLTDLRIGRSRIFVGAGRSRIRESGRVTGLWFGDLTVNPGLKVEFAGTLFGSLYLEPGAEVTVTGRVTGRIESRDYAVADSDGP